MNINEKFFEPIHEATPEGEYLRYDNVYDEIKLAMKEDDARLPQGVWETDIKKADWKKVKGLCEDILINKSKDFQIVIWWLESQLQINKWKGAAEGFDTLLQFSQKFWENAFPKLEDNDFDYRLSPFVYLCNKLPDELIFLPISNPQNSDSSEKDIADLIEAKNESSEQQQAKLFSEIRKSQSSTPDMFFIENQHYIEKALLSVKNLDKFLSDKTKNASPSFGRIIQILETVNTEIKNILSSKNVDLWAPDVENYEYIKKPDIPKEEPLINADSIPQQEETNSENPLNDATLEQAYDALYQISIFLEEKQPQSIIPALLKVAIFLNSRTFSEIVAIKTSDGEPILNCISKLAEVIK